METIALGFVYLLYAYFGIGLLFAIFFLVKGLEKIDASVKGTPTRFRFLMIPGTLAFWPLLLQKWLKLNEK